MKSNRVRFLLCLLFFVALAAISFRCAWPAHHIFSASDMSIGRLALKKHTLPEQLTGFYVATPVVGESSYRYILYNVIVALLPLSLVANTIYGLILVSGSTFTVWFLRLWNRSWASSVFGGLVAFWFNSVLLASGGHGYKMEVLALSVLSLCLVEKAVRSETLRGTIGFSLFCGLSVGVMMLEVQDVAMNAGLFIGAYTLLRLLQRHPRAVPRYLAVLVPVGVTGLLLAGGLVLKSYERNIAGAAAVQQSGQEKWNYITQWSLVPDEWPDLIAPGWSGWSSGNPDGPYWGRVGQDAEWEQTGRGFRNFKLTTSYLGIIPFLLGGFGLVAAFRNRKSEDGLQVLFWAAAGLVGFLLATGKYSPLYKLYYHLPVVGSIRAPIKFMDNFQICLGFVAAYGLDRLIADGKGRTSAKVLWIVSVALGGLMLLTGWRLRAFPGGWVSEFTEMGYGRYADLMVRNMSNAWLHAAVLAFVAGALALVVWKGLKQARWAGGVFAAVLLVDSLLLTSHYFRAEDISSLKRGNPVVNYIKANQGNERTFLVDQGGIYNQWLASDGPYHRLNIFNIWQMPRMPVEYERFLSVVGRNQIRLWELSAVRFITAPADVYEQLRRNPQLAEHFESAMSYSVPTRQGAREDVLLVFKNFIPRMAAFQGWDVLPPDQHCETLADPQHDPRKTLLLAPDAGLEPQAPGDAFIPLEGRLSKKNAVVEVNLEKPSVVRFSQRLQPGWRVLVDGEEAPLLQVDYLCMGVRVPAGSHTVEFMCPSGMARALFALGVLVVAGMAGALLIRWGRVKPDG